MFLFKINIWDNERISLLFIDVGRFESRVAESGLRSEKRVYCETNDRGGSMYIGIDLGGTNIAAGLLDTNGSLIFTHSVPTGAGREESLIIDDIVGLIELIKSEAEGKGAVVEGVGIGVPGVVDPSLSNVLFCTNLGWTNIKLKEIIEKRTGIKTFTDNDANLAGLAEFGLGALKGSSNCIIATLGTGIGGGIIINGELCRGSYGISAEIGHMVIGENFYDCTCGKNGCFETFASATGIIRYAEKLVADGDYDAKVLLSYCKDGKVTAKAVFDAAKEGDALGNLAVDRLVKYLCIGFTNIINTVDPELIAISGGVSQAGSFLVDKINSEMEKYVLVKNFPHAKVVLAELGNDSGVIGAALLAKTECER